MALEQRLNLKLAQKLVMTPTLQQAIKLLQLSRLELEQALAQEVQTNPVLEMTEEGPLEEEAAPGTEPASPEDGAEPDGEPPVENASGEAEATPPEPGEPTNGETDPFGEVEVEALFSNYLHDTPSVASSWEEGEESRLENSAAPEQSLFDALCAQIRLAEVPPDLRPVCEYVIGNIDPDGFLRTSDADLAAAIGVDPETLSRAIVSVQALDPAGIAARNLQECFAIQLRRYTQPVDPHILELARTVVGDAFDDLLHQRWDALSSHLSIPKDEIRAVVELLRRLNPRPGTELGPDENSVIEPDVTVTKAAAGWRVSLNDDGFPRLRLSARYVRLLQSRTIDGEATSYLRERMRAALWFLRSVDQRQSTILRVAEAIVKRQKDFLDAGVTRLRPLVLRDIADDLGIHESTVSRVVANKYMATPRGVFPLKFFFHSAISHAVDGEISSVVVKQRIRELIEQESPEKPLSDARVARQLNRLGIRIARRTVAKYREDLGVPSSEQRKRVLR